MKKLTEHDKKKLKAGAAGIAKHTFGRARVFKNKKDITEKTLKQEKQKGIKEN